jgi:phenylalanyl-tRNA synthetase beta chain
VIKNVNTKAATPEWMERALARSGIRQHSILVDITNYVLIELGQPMHAFDGAKIQGGIQVRQATAAEKLVSVKRARSRATRRCDGDCR